MSESRDASGGVEILRAVVTSNADLCRDGTSSKGSQSTSVWPLGRQKVQGQGRQEAGIQREGGPVNSAPRLATSSQAADRAPS